MIKISPMDQLKNLDAHGTQSKWLKDNFWYKTDDFNHEGLAETIFGIQMERNIDYFITPKKEKMYENYIDKIKNKINDAEININNGDLIASRNNETPISFLVKRDKNVEVLKNNIQISDNELLFNYHEEFKFYRDLYYALNNYDELENSNIERLDR